MNLEKYIKNAGHSSLLDIQIDTIRATKNNSYIVLLSKTGSGKTFAFLLSILSQLDPESKNVQAVIIAPTRELSIQIEREFKSLKSNFKSTLCYGGHPMKTERNSLENHPSIVIGTPGRLCDHIEKGNLDLSFCKISAVDEYDKCLEFGFQDDMDYILNESDYLEKKLFVSATKMEDFFYRNENEKPFIINRITEDDTIDKTEYLVEYKRNIHGKLIQLLTSFGQEKAIVFCNYREVVEDIVSRLEDENMVCIPYHGGLDQDLRERALIKYRNNSSNILVCTDLGSRGLDIPEIKHVVHFQYPSSEEAFIHRNGRTARMTASGSIYLFKGESTQLPEYLNLPQERYQMSEKEYEEPEWITLYFGGGKKEKINKIDIVGFLSKKGNLKKGDVGIIEVIDHYSYAAVKRKRVNQLLGKIKDERIKGKKIKIAISE